MDLQVGRLVGNQWTRADPITRFLPKVKWSENRHEGTRCLEWTAAHHPEGYGRFGVPGGVVVMAHRWLYERWTGPIPDGLVLDHLCRNPPCVNPHHLEPVTPLENLARGVDPNAPRRAAESCKHGHAFDDANTYWHGGRRQCRRCNAAAAARLARRKRGGAA